MPASTQALSLRRRRVKQARPPAVIRTTAIMVIDHERLQSAAWAEFHTARKRLDKAMGDLHRHEETDVPAYNSWLHRTFPLLISRLRELHEEVALKARKVQTVQMQAAFSGGSLKRIWREQKDIGAKPDFDDEDRDSSFQAGGATGGSRYNSWTDDFEPPPAPTPTQSARDIYRRLVQHLHPDRGGKWTAARERLWHEVQEAWNAADTDWLARLEVEWESANDVIGPSSPLSRLRRAIEELQAARRNTEQKLREYRRSPPWRFTRNEKNRAILHHQTKTNFAHDIEFLQHQLDYLNATIAAWEDDWTRPKSRQPKSRSKPSQRSRRPNRGI